MNLTPTHNSNQIHNKTNSESYPALVNKSAQLISRMSDPESLTSTKLTRYYIDNGKGVGRYTKFSNNPRP
ncbi:MAG: hypothetical protein KA716_22910 [Gloeotrichia echinulata DEX184]|nr:hypothetical protein [Gloeotrichia echinulata DEX184]